MSAMPNTMKLGMAAAYLGAIGAFASMAMIWTGDLSNAGLIAADLIVVMMFFATAGCFSSYSPVKGNTVVVISALTIAFTAVATFYGAMGLFPCILLMAFGIVCVVCGNLSSTKDYVDTNRVI